MKKRTKIMIGLAALCAGTLVFGACSSDESPYKEYAKEHYDFSVCFDANGGKAAGKNNSRIVNTYRYEDVQKGIKLFKPEDTNKGAIGTKSFNVERNGYFLAGWYAVREPRVNADGEPLDEEGNVCRNEEDMRDEAGNLVYDEDGNVRKAYYSDHGKPQGYTYAEEWDFNSLLQRDDFVYEEGEYAFTLYAAWVPEFSYELQAQEREWECERCGTKYYSATKPDKCTADIETGEFDEDGDPITATCNNTLFQDNGLKWYSVCSYTFDVVNQEAERTVAVPAWNEDTGVMEYGKFGRPFDKTFVAAYSSEEDLQGGTDALSVLENHGTWDPATATATGNIARFYGKWEEGLWYRIRTKEQLAEYAGVNRSFDLLANLEYGEEDEWPAAFSTGTFTGTFRGNGHTISGVTVHQTDVSVTKGGLFATVTAAARFENITFENVTYSIEAASRGPKGDSMYGLFAGDLASGATITNMKISGELSIADTVYYDAGYDPDTGLSTPVYPYQVGLFSGSYVTCGVSVAGITLKTNRLPAAVVDADTGEIKIGR